MAGSSQVQVYVYDLTKGLARSMSMALLGKQLEGVWHTGIVVYGEEFFFGGMGIESCPPGGTMLGQPDSIVSLGETEIPSELFMEHLSELAQTTFRTFDYNLLHRNCNNFSSEIGQFLTGNDIPAHITNLPDEILSTPFGQMMKPMLDAMSLSPGDGAQPLFQNQQSSRPSHIPDHPTPSSLSSSSSSTAVNKTSLEIVTYMPSQVTSDQVYSTGQPRSELVYEMIEYCFTAQCDWSISYSHIESLYQLLSSEQCDVQLAAWKLFQAAFLKTETAELMKRQKNIAYFAIVSNLNDSSFKVEAYKSLCNLCSTSTGYRLAVLRDSTRVVSHHEVVQLACGGIMDEDPELVSVCTALAVNIAVHHEKQDDFDVSTSSALVEILTQKILDSTTAKQSLIALEKFMANNSEIVLLAFAMGLDLEKYKNTPDLASICHRIGEMYSKIGS